MDEASKIEWFIKNLGKEDEGYLDNLSTLLESVDINFDDGKNISSVPARLVAQFNNSERLVCDIIKVKECVVRDRNVKNKQNPHFWLLEITGAIAEAPDIYSVDGSELTITIQDRNELVTFDGNASFQYQNNGIFALIKFSGVGIVTSYVMTEL